MRGGSGRQNSHALVVGVSVRWVGLGVSWCLGSSGICCTLYPYCVWLGPGEEGAPPLALEELPGPAPCQTFPRNPMEESMQEEPS
jgi:hypothetical protein